MASLPHTGSLFEGQMVDFFSASHDLWMPATVLQLDQDTGAAEFTAKPGRWLALDEQRARLRCRSEPTEDQLHWIEDVLADEKRLSREVNGLIQRHAVRGEGKVLRRVAGEGGLDGAGAELDARLGICGSLSSLLSRLAASGAEHFTEESLSEACEMLLRHAHQRFGLALRRRKSGGKRSGLVRDRYDFGDACGRGAFSKVFLAMDRKSNVRRAMKVVNTRNQGEVVVDQVQHEIERLSFLDHPHIVRLHENYLNSGYVFMCLDFCPGGDLEELVGECCSAGGSLPERFSLDVVEQVLQAVSYLHGLSLMHLDVKPGNVMLGSAERQPMLPASLPGDGVLSLPALRGKPHALLVDFGLCRAFEPGCASRQPVMGTPYTMAPEVWRGTLTPKADVFSCGALMLQLLCTPGSPAAFTGRLRAASAEDEAREAERYWADTCSKLCELLHGCSPPARALCRRLLELRRRARPSAAEALRAAPFEGAGAEREEAEALAAVLHRIAQAPTRTLMTNSLALSVVRRLPPDALPELHRAFKRLDRMQEGRLDKASVAGALVDARRLDTEPAQAAAEALDLACAGWVSWSDFAAACLDFSADACRDELRRIFAELQRPEDGLVTLWGLAEFLAAEHLPSASFLHNFLGGVDPEDLHRAIDWTAFCGKVCTADCADVAAAWKQALWFESARDYLSKAVGAIGDLRLPFAAKHSHAPEGVAEVVRPHQQLALLSM